jgi:hypothetical protein
MVFIQTDLISAPQRSPFFLAPSIMASFGKRTDRRTEKSPFFGQANVNGQYNHKYHCRELFEPPNSLIKIAPLIANWRIYALRNHF